MARQYQHLSAEERAVIQIERRNGSSLRAIARGLDRDVSTVSRELARNEVEMEPGMRVRYEAKTAGMAYRLRRTRSVRPRKLVEGSWLHERVQDHLVYDRWSP
ncbi:MAG TPA: helix-turn-helix domain-containing protein, partial [Dokdonella sp.]|uniref:helix-turn-helix domain-containing protein n=1 Tax=Dokdonella sp. TaxID=2291710 RepID=UPI002B632123